MLSFRERFELLERDLRAVPPAFVMSVELPFAIFRYDPSHPDEDEWQVRREIDRLATRTQNTLGKTVHLLPLSKLYWQSILSSEGIDAVIELERFSGFLSAEEQVSTYLSDPDWHPLTEMLIRQTDELDPDHDIVFLTRAGVFAPASYRISALLEQLMGRIQVPTVMFYPGTWRGSLNYLGLRRDDEPLGSYRVKIYGREA